MIISYDSDKKEITIDGEREFLNNKLTLQAKELLDLYLEHGISIKVKDCC